MKLNNLARTLVILAFAVLPVRLSAQMDMIFTNDSSALKNVSALKVPKDTLQVFRGGDAVWGVLRTNGKFPNVTGFSRLKDGNRVIRIVMLDYKDIGARSIFDPMDSVDVKLTPEDLAKQTFTFAIIPNSFDASAPAFEQLIRKFGDADKKRVLVVVRVHPDNADNTLRSGFWVDLTQGLGRYAEWKNNFSAIDAARVAERDKPLVAARTSFFAAYQSKLNDAALEKAFPVWWKSHVDTKLELIRTRTPSVDWKFVRNANGIVLSKRVTVLYAYRRSDTAKCFMEWQEFGYESLGGAVFDTQLKGWAPGNQVFNIPGEQLDSGRGYEVDCTGVSR